MSHETPRKTALALLRLTMILLLASVGTMILEIFVRQTPYSPYQIALPIDPFEQLRGTALVLALVGFCLHSLVERGLFGAKEPWALVGLFGTGAVGTVVNLDGVKETAPQNDEEWAALAGQAAALVESGNLLLMGNRVIDNGDWVTITRTMIEKGQLAIKAAEAHDKEGILDAGSAINETCDTCHAKYQRQ